MANISKELVLSYIQKYHPATIQDLKNILVKEGVRSTDQSLVKAVQELQSAGTISLHNLRNKNYFATFFGDFFNSWWVYFAIMVSVAEVVLVAYPSTALPLQLLRMVFGLILLGFLPGYATVQCLFPKRDLGELEQLLLSIFLSVAISIAIGVALGFQYVFTALNSVTVSAIYCVTISVLASYRQYKASVSNSAVEAKS